MRIHLLAGLCALFLTACPQTSPAPEAGPVMVNFPVPPGQARDVASALNRVIGGEGTGASLVGSADQIVVVAPPSMLPGIEQLIEDLGRDGGATHIAQDVEIAYWMVSGTPGEGHVDIPTSASAGIEAIIKRSGPQHLELLQAVSVRSLSGEQGKSSTRQFSVRQRAAVSRDGTIVTEIEMEDEFGASIDTTVRLSSGQTMVLGQLGGREGHENETLYYIIQGTVFEN